MRIRVPLAPANIDPAEADRRVLRRPSRWRLSLRAWVILVALVAVALTYCAGGRRERYRRLMIFHAVMERRALRSVSNLQQSAKTPSAGKQAAYHLAVVERMADFHGGERRRFGAAMWQPWRREVPAERFRDLGDEYFADPAFEREYRRSR